MWRTRTHKNLHRGACRVAPRIVACLAGAQDALGRELRAGLVSAVDVVAPCAIVAAIGERMAAHPSAPGRFMGALGNAGVRVLAIAQVRHHLRDRSNPKSRSSDEWRTRAH